MYDSDDSHLVAPLVDLSGLATQEAVGPTQQIGFLLWPHQCPETIIRLI